MVHPRSLGGQLHGGFCLGIGHALFQKLVYDKQYGRRSRSGSTITSRSRFSMCRRAAMEALYIPDPQTPIGARGVGEAAIWARVRRGDERDGRRRRRRLFRRTPVKPELIMSLEPAGGWTSRSGASIKRGSASDVRSQRCVVH